MTDDPRRIDAEPSDADVHAGPSANGVPDDDVAYDYGDEVFGDDAEAAGDVPFVFEDGAIEEAEAGAGDTEPAPPVEARAAGRFSFVNRVLMSLFGFSDRGLLPGRLADLDGAIARHPNAPANYVLRGEVYLKAGEYALAESDFRRALALAEDVLAAGDWALVEQAMQDRAVKGLAETKHKLRA